MYEAILYIAVAYILLCKLNHGYLIRHIFINIFQMEHFSALKFCAVSVRRGSSRCKEGGPKIFLELQCAASAAPKAIARGVDRGSRGWPPGGGPGGRAQGGHSASLVYTCVNKKTRKRGSFSATDA